MALGADNNHVILIVDDLEANRLLLCDFMAALGHTPVPADSGSKALELLPEIGADTVLLDVMMPDMNGTEVLNRIKGDPMSRHVPVIMVSGVDDVETLAACIKSGADDYLTKPFNVTLLEARLSATLAKKRLHDHEERIRVQIEENNRELERRVQEQVHEISDAQLSTIFALSNLAESRDPETGEHLLRMREYVRLLATHMQSARGDVITDTYIDVLYAASPLHDIGKVGVPDSILQKPGRLTAEEFEIMKTHTTIGARTLRAVHESHPSNAFIGAGIEIAQSHHEKWDGTGYPQGLAGDTIPLAARILALADVYDALTSKRCYKDAFTHEKSRSIVLEGRGSHFDPAVVAAFERCESDFIVIRERWGDPEATAAPEVGAV